MFKSTRLTTKSVNRLSELPEDNDEEADNSRETKSGQSTTGNDNQPTSESSSFSLARAETRMIFYYKALLLVVIALFAAAIGTVTYFIIYNQEEMEYHARVRTDLMRQIFGSDGGGPQINLTPSTQVPYDHNFRMFICTKLANPHYLPDVSIKVTLVNFTVTMEGLEDQMLGEVVSIEKRELEEEKNKIIKTVSQGQKQLKAMEESILEKLKNEKGNILDNNLNYSSLESNDTHKLGHCSLLYFLVPIIRLRMKLVARY